MLGDTVVKHKWTGFSNYKKKIIRIIANDTVTDINVLFRRYRVMSVYIAG